MAIANYKTFVAGEVLTAADLNGLQSHFTGNATALVSPFTATVDLDGHILVIDADADSTLRETSDDVIALRLQGLDAFIFDGDATTPVNGLTFRSSATGAPVELQAQGSDTNISVRILPKGTGTVRGATIGGGDYTYTFSSTTSMADPGSGTFRVNNATPSSVTAIAISDTDGLSLDRDAVFDGLTEYWMTIYLLTLPTTYVRFRVLSSTDNGAWHQLSVLHKQSSGTWTNGDVCAVVLEKAPVRETLTANQTLYVRTDGSDSNNGLANTAAGAFLTIQAAINKCYTIDQNGYDITIQIGNGTYTAAVLVDKKFTGIVTLVGDATTPSNVIISTTSAQAFECANPGSFVQLSGIKFLTTTAGNGIYAHTGGVVRITGKCEFGAVANAQINAQTSGQVQIQATVLISGSAQYFIQTLYSGVIRCPTISVTLSGTPAFSQSFAFAYGLSLIYASSITFSGSATGQRYNGQFNAFIETAGGGATYFPGDVAGSTTTGAQYN